MEPRCHRQEIVSCGSDLRQVSSIVPASSCTHALHTQSQAQATQQGVDCGWRSVAYLHLCQRDLRPQQCLAQSVSWPYSPERELIPGLRSSTGLVPRITPQVTVTSLPRGVTDVTSCLMMWSVRKRNYSGTALLGHCL